MRERTQSPWFTWGLPLALVAAIFAIELYTPLGVAEWIFYIVPVAVAARAPTRRPALVVGVLSTACIVAGALLSPPGVPREIAWPNRAAGIVVLWLVERLLARRNAQTRALQASEERFETLFYKSSLAAALTRRADLRVVDVNDAWLALFGIDRAALIGKTFEEAGLRAAAAMRRAPVGVGATSEDRDVEVSFDRSDGTTRTILARVDEIEIDGAPFALWSAQDITTRRAAEATSRRLQLQLLEAEEAERRRIARDLHDSTAQALIAVLVKVDGLRERLAVDRPAEAVTLEDSVAMLEHAATELRTLAYLLHPPQLEEWGLEGAIQHYVGGFTDRTGLAVHAEVAHGMGRLSRTHELVLFRVLQETLTNVLRHARSPHAEVSLRRDHGHVLLEVRDFGVGLPTGYLERLAQGAVPGAGVGLPGMAERVRLAGGRLEFEAATPGTRVRVILPPSSDDA